MIRSLLCGLALLISTNLLAAPKDDLTTLLNGIQTMKAEFTQTIYDNRGKVVQQQHGTMALQRPGRFRWDIKKPIPQLIVANNTRLWVYDPDLEQVTIRLFKNAAGDTPVTLLSNTNASLDKDYSVQAGKNDNGLEWFELAPKQPDSSFAGVEIGFANEQIQEMRLKDHLGHTTRIQFQHAKFNMALADSLFNFKPGANIDVIDETRKTKK